MIEMKLDAKEVLAKIRKLSDYQIVEARRKAAEKLVVEVPRTIEYRLLNDEAGLRRLAPSTVAKKRRKGSGFPTTPLVDFGMYASSWRGTIYVGGRNSVVIGFRPEGSTDRGVPFTTLAMWFEHGTRYMPKRPAMAKLLRSQEFRQKLVSYLETEVKRVLGSS